MALKAALEREGIDIGQAFESAEVNHQVQDGFLLVQAPLLRQILAQRRLPYPHQPPYVSPNCRNGYPLLRRHGGAGYSVVSGAGGEGAA